MLTSIITEPTQLNVTSKITDVTCSGLLNGKIEQTVIGYPSQNNYTISLNKLFTNVILIRLIDTSFTNPNKTIFDCGEEKNNRIYFQSIENISEIQFIEIGLHSSYNHNQRAIFGIGYKIIYNLIRLCFVLST